MNGTIDTNCEYGECQAYADKETEEISATKIRDKE